MTDATERFAALVRGDDGIALDEGALLIAAHAHPSLDIPARLVELDALAADVADTTATASAVASGLFAPASRSGTEPGAFTGNTVDYYDPANSYLDDVLDRRLGIPITLSVLMIEVGRRAGVALHGVGMPGHFLVGVTPAPGTGPVPVEFFDPFHGGARLDVEACAHLFAQVHGAAEGFRPEYLAPVGPRAVLDRMLANLQQTFLARAPGAAAWPTRLRLQFPDLTPARRSELAALLGRLGQFSEAATVFEELAGELSGTTAEQAARAATQLRARAN